MVSPENHDKLKIWAVVFSNIAAWFTQENVAIALGCVSIVWITTQWLKFIVNWAREERSRKPKE